jgi:uncharacterized membrane protein YjfL (UPF0719 family)
MKKKKWQGLYLQLFDIKTTTCIYFVVFVFFYLVYGGIDPDSSTMLEFSTSVQILFACLLIGFGQALILPKNELSVPRILLWGGCSLIVTIGFTEGFKWFGTYPKWYSIVFYGIIAISFLFIWLAFYWRSQSETKELNEALNKFKEKKTEI